ncbi:MAG TPA: 8-amino-7-oxononanoate synthase [Candidatus Dormibacteraeota bacterium]|nr:8-amino-7-oxononanoate synthase [Candidatus Dormibacteraeota bacterium]
MPSEFNDSLLAELEAGLRELESRSQRRTLVEISGVNLCSNDYLGLADNPALKQTVTEAMVKAARIGGTGSRLLSGHAAVWNELEEEFAAFAGSEAALYFGSGYAANIGLLTSLANKNDVIFSDALNHASIIDGIRLSGARKVIYPHRDLNALESSLKENQSVPGRKLIVTETVFSMDGDVALLDAIVALAEKHGASVIVDEAHATAVHGPGGRGIAPQLLADGRVLAAMHTCGKALASAGAFVCGPAVLREHLINHARTFIFSTAMPPYMAEQIRAALRLAAGMDKERAELLSRSRNFAKSLQHDGWATLATTTQIVPAVIGANDAAVAAAEFLQRAGFAVRAIRPPTVPPGSARLRFSVTHKISAAELERLAAALSTWRAQSYPSIPVALAGSA